MKKLKRILSVLIILSMLFTLCNFNVFAEDQATEDSADTTETEVLTTIVKPTDFGSVIMSTTTAATSRPAPSTFNAYINKYRTSNVYYRYMSMITSYDIPLKDKIQTVAYRMYGHNSGGQSSNQQYIPLYYQMCDFPVTTEEGVYTKDEDDIFTQLYDYVYANHWSGKTYKLAINMYQANATIDENNSYVWYFDITNSFLSNFQSDDSNIVTFGTGLANKNLNFKCRTSAETYLPYLQLTFNKSDIMDYINTATEENIAEVIENLGKLGFLSTSTVGYTTYANMNSAMKNIAAGKILAVKPDEGYSEIAEIVTAYDAAVPEAIMEYANSAADAASMAAVIDGLGGTGVLSTSTIGYDKFASMSDGFKSSIAAKMLEIKGESFADTDAVASAFDTAMSEGILGYVNTVNSENVGTVIKEIGMMNVINTTNYDLLSDGAKAQIAEAFLSAKGDEDFADTAAVTTAFESAVSVGILYEVNNAHEKTIASIITNLSTMGIIDLTEYNVLDDASKVAVQTALLSAVVAVPVTTTDEIVTTFETALNAGILNYVNSATSETIGEVITNIGTWGVLDSSSMKYTSYTTVTDEVFINYINAAMAESVGELSSLDEVRTAYDKAFETAAVNYVTTATVDTMGTVIANIGNLGLLAGTSIEYSKYDGMEESLKTQVNEKLFTLISKGAITDFASIKTAYESAMSLAYIYCTVEPEDYAMAILSKDSGRASSVAATAKTLGIYVNQKYTYDNYLHGHHSSIISSYNLPLKNAIENMEITYFITTGAGATNRYIPIFYKLTNFPIDLQQGYYAGEKTTESTDENGETVTTTETTEEFTKVKEFTDLYWPASDSSYSSPGGLSSAGKIYQGITSGAVNKFDV